jgi:hypothetical protein
MGKGRADDKTPKQMKLADFIEYNDRQAMELILSL